MTSFRNRPEGDTGFFRGDLLWRNRNKTKVPVGLLLVDWLLTLYLLMTIFGDSKVNKQHIVLISVLDWVENFNLKGGFEVS